MDDNSLSDSNVKVAVRVRPMNRREKDLKTKCVVEMDGNQTVLHPAVTSMNTADPRNQPKVFAYDYCFWSMDDSQKDKFAGQDVVFQCLGESLLDNAFMGYNACIFAYGQTGSGKSYTMMGSSEQPGLIPRLCSSLFSRTEKEAREGESFTVEVSYMEIYNEKVRDLLDPKGSRQALKVREHKVLGPYVDGLSRLAVTSYKDIESLMSEGNKSRTVAATNMNEESSRSHAVFNIILTHTLTDLRSGTSGEKVSKLSLVDLAGSERAAKTGAAGERLKEGSNINKSLSTLGLVISALADHGAGKNKSKFVPYRDSVLTWLLKDSLGGNSRTAMVATISPAADNYDETLSTLRYADRAKNIINHAVVNEDPNARIIRELREEVEKLKEQLTEAESMKAPELKERLEESEKLIQDMTVTWEDKLRKTEAIAQERQRQLESLGISLQSSGIRVVDEKCYLVNLNADPALNELLVYYLKDHTRVGSADSQDIQLCGMAIQAEHCVIDVTESHGVELTPHRNAKTYVNGTEVVNPVQLHHGDRILWGNNHFFRINLPRHKVQKGGEDEEGAAMTKCSSSDCLEVGELDAYSDVSSERSFGYEFAQAEVMMKGVWNNDPLQSVLQTLEKQHQEEKRCALERQRQMYEQELQQLRQRVTPEKPSGVPGSATAAVMSASSNKRVRRWSEDREAMITRSLRRLKEQIVRARLLAQEAGFIAEELNKRTEYLVTLQIPAANLDANRKRDAVLSEPAIQVRRKGKGKQIWALEKMENRLVDMRELYQEWKELDEDNPVMRSYFKRADPFFDEQENHSLIGVANVFLACLFYDVKLQYAVPIINQKGEVAGRLHVEVWRGTESLEEEGGGGHDKQLSSTDGDERRLCCVVKILQATGLPRHLSNFVFCQYHFWAQEEPVFTAPEVASSSSASASRDPQCTVVFDSTKELSVPVSEDFVEFLAEGAVAIEVYGHKQANHRRNLALWDLGVIQAKTRSLRERWSEVTRQLELWVKVMELNEAGEFTAVEVVPAKDVRTGGIFQLRQGQSRRVQVEVRPVPDSGTMPLVAASILSVSIGDVKVRQVRLPKNDPKQGTDEEMDSYQEVDLERMREQWLVTLTQRQEYLDQQLQKIVCKAARADKSEDDVERESQLLECRLTLTEERNAVMVPSAGSGIPGAPVERVPVPGMETHTPVLFLDLSADDFQSSLSAPLAGGQDALLSGEDEDDFFDLHIVKHYDPEVKAEASWDSTVHECPQLSRVAPADQRVYLTLRTVVQLSHPAHMQLVLRKRICVSVTGRQGFAQSLLKRMSQRSTVSGCGITFEVVSNIPGDIHGPEDREMLARLAASAEDEQSADSEAAIEKYLRSVLAVENILTLDRLRQSLPRIVVQSASVEEDMSKQQQAVPIDETEIPRSVPLPPPIIPETEDSTASPVSEASSGYMSTSISTVTLSEVYTLSWDLPSSYGSRDGFETVLDEHEEENVVTQKFSPFSDTTQSDTLILDQSGPQELLSLKQKADAECLDQEPSKPDVTPSQQEPNQFLSDQLKEAEKSDPAAEAELPDQTEQKQDHGSEQRDHSETHKDSEVARKNGTNQTEVRHVDHSEPKTASKEDLEVAATNKVECELALSNETQQSAQEGERRLESTVPQPQQPTQDQTASDFIQDPSPSLIQASGPDPGPPVDLGAQASSKQQSTSDVPETNGASFLPSSSATSEVQQPAASVKPAKGPISSPKSGPSVANPFKIQKVKSSDLKSFLQILSEEEHDKPTLVDQHSSCGTGPNVSVPKENLEIISDTEDGDTAASAVLPEWLKEGEFVSVGANKSGTVRYLGPTDFAEGIWVGVELEVPAGKNDGSVAGKHYFHCNPGYGVLVRPDRVTRGGAKRHRQQQQKRRSANLSGSSPNLAALTALAKGEGGTGSTSRSRGENRKSWNT
ncbi:kinesin-like protein KIF13B isoform X4 [Oreochromis aureus]|uniref:kinesin-like protein KIF13B isoform X4 n=1 Tax=Oreochromis aureus TaxID=47969 RepID=UPI0019545DC6|nr:kinesin-like protein KIF13B isoform X4 [Oreochromis aureus]